MDPKIKVIVVDDEMEAREGLRILLENDNDITLVTTCKNGIEAIEALTEFTIDLMFLDIQMPMVDGFEVVRSVPVDRMPLIVFCTAYDQYAVKAFEVHAVDYLLKPFTDERFQEALSRAKSIIRQKNQEENIRKMRSIASDLESHGSDNLLIEKGLPGLEKKLIVKESGKIHFINLSEVIWIEAFDYYVKVHVSNRFYTIRDSMKKMIERLPGDQFIRIHKSTIISRNYIQSVDPLGNGEYQVHLKLGTQHKVSRSYKDSIKGLIK